jgi:hypothetical protein
VKSRGRRKRKKKEAGERKKVGKEREARGPGGMTRKRKKRM